MAKDFSIIIAHRDISEQECPECHKNHVVNASAAPFGVWATVHSIEMDLENSGYDYDYSFMINGVTKQHPDTFNNIYYLRKSGKLAYAGFSEDRIAPPLARQRAVENCDGKLLFFFDSHILVKPGYFKRAIEQMQRPEIDMLHSSTRFYQCEGTAYHYKLKLGNNFWGEAMTVAKDFTNPYRIAASGHGGFVVRRSVWEEVGGYGWNGFQDYGGEEMYFDLKMAMLGKSNWLDPQMIHYHYAGNRGYRRHFTDNFFINMMAVANIIGGEPWMQRVYESFSTQYFKMKTGKSMFDLMCDAQDRSKEHALWLQQHRIRTLDQQLDWFTANDIPW